MIRKKIYYVICILLFSVSLAGFAKTKVELLDSKKLIDLDKAIHYSLPGADADSKADPSDKDTEAPASDTTHDRTAPHTYIISVRDETIRLDGDAVRSPDALRSTLGSKNTAYDSFVLKDDWAESVTYKEVLKILNELQLHYSEE